MIGITILGSTGSIGTQTLDIVREYREDLRVVAIAANRQVDLVEKQVREFTPKFACMYDEAAANDLKTRLADTDTVVLSGMDGLIEISTLDDIDMVVTAIVGMIGLRPTIAAINAHKDIALANKETLVVAGALICQLAQKYHAPILPVDSEHSAIFQSIVGEGDNEIEKILLTASGGPFRTFTMEQLANVTQADALKHPTWNMGKKITIDSASMINKGFEVIEAKWLFGIDADKIEVLVHPQSIVHSAVQFADGAVKAQLGVPDMRLPIQYAFSFPKRFNLTGDRLDLFSRPLEFFKPDLEKFRCLALSFEAIRKGGNMPCILNAANEIVNKAFLEDRCGFLQMADVIEQAMNTVSFDTNPDYDVYVATDKEARRVAKELLKL